MEHWLEREIAQWVQYEGSIQRPIAPRANALTTELHLALYVNDVEKLTELSTIMWLKHFRRAGKKIFQLEVTVAFKSETKAFRVPLRPP